MINAPQHVAIIMDGNGRWAKKRLMPRLAGHKAGRKAARAAIELAARNPAIHTLTLFAFSTENWSRPDDEVSGLMRMFSGALAEEAGQLKENGIHLCFVGDLSRFSTDLQRQMQDAERLTRGGSNLRLQLALNYGGRADIAQAVTRLVDDVQSGHLKAGEVSENDIAKRLYGAEAPPLDLLIRTGGERRISNFLLWDIAYAELYFSDVLWPDFDEKAFSDALDWFASRERRFGQTGEQLGND